MIELGQDSPNYVCSALLTKKIRNYHEDMKTLAPFFEKETNLIRVSSDQAFDKTMEAIYEKLEPTIIHVRPGAGAAAL